MAAPRFRVMTYNVHRCVGRGGRDSTGDVAALCRESAPDLVALQEVDAPGDGQEAGEHGHHEGVDHARDVAAALGMTLLFCRTFRRGVGYYGHALLSRAPLELVRVTTFPASHHGEPRGAIWARAEIAGRRLEVVSTHLGVMRRERQEQSQELVGGAWLGSPEMGRYRLLCGDLNAVPRATTYRRIAGSRLRDAQRGLPGHEPLPTFPSAWPFLRLDHVFVSEDVRVRQVTVPHDARARRASDHLPLIVDLELA
jgi:endonuclease/exonuclease/phosphatase family metal-dependent hydrolase